MEFLRERQQPDVEYEEIFSQDSIKLAYFRLKYFSRDRSDLIDSMGNRFFGLNLEKNCKILSNKLLTGKYFPKKAIKFYQPKANNLIRVKTILAVEMIKEEFQLNHP